MILKVMLTESTVDYMSARQRSCMDDDGSILVELVDGRIRWKIPEDTRVNYDPGPYWEIEPMSVQRIIGKPELPRSDYKPLTDQLLSKACTFINDAQYLNIIHSDDQIWFAAQAIKDPTKISFFNKPLRAIQYYLLRLQRNNDFMNQFRDQYAVMTRPGRFFQKFGVTDTESLEKITGAFTGYKFELVEGEDIRKYYSGSWYTATESSPLHSSCMRNSGCQPYFDFYVDHLKMLVAFDLNGCILGRALLWEGVTTAAGEEITFLDRIYGVNAFVETAKIYARDRGWYHKQKQNYFSHQLVVGPEGHNITMDMEYSCTDTYDTYPYMDTFNFLTEGTGFSNANGDRNLEGLDGNLSNTCDACGVSITEENDYADDYGDGHYCLNCWAERFTRCDNCSETVSIDEAVFTDFGNYCPDCIDDVATACHECSEYVQTAYDHGGHEYCLSCITSVEEPCATCGEETIIMELDDNDGICTSCAQIANEKEESNEQTA